tara:strand:+ start:2210 stop:2431 length:222 start_codon:yes stop_codon:yes gene_type:complete
MIIICKIFGHKWIWFDDYMMVDRHRECKRCDEKIWSNQVDDLIDEWHEGNSKVSLVEFLGMSKEEYSKWVIEK